MVKTPYSPKNQSFTDKAHKAAREQIYPKLFLGNPLLFETCNVGAGGIGAIYDGEMSIDYIVKVWLKDFKLPLRFTIQERFREAKYADFKDVTITAWNYQTDKPSELYKMDCSLFVYGYYDDTEDTFLDWVVFCPQSLKIALIEQRLVFNTGMNPRSNQSFITIAFDALRDGKLLVFSKSALQTF